MKKNCKELKTLFIQSIENYISIEEKPQGCLIKTPYMDFENDFIYFMAIPLNDNEIRLTDLGNTFRKLFEKGIEITSQRNIFVHNIEKGLGVFVDDESVIEKITTKEDIGLSIILFSNAIKEINDLIYTARPKEIYDFKDTVRLYIRENNIIHKKNIPILGESQIEHVFDFGFKNNEIIAETLHADTKGGASNVINRSIVKFNDVRDSRKKRELVAIYNDKSKIVDSKYFRILEKTVNYSIPWKNREELLEIIS